MKPDTAPLSPTLVGGLCALAFTTMFTYAIGGSACQSLFISAYGSKNLPWVWLGVAAASAVATAWLSHEGRKYDVVRLFGRACAASAFSLVLLLAWHASRVPGAAYALYVWKDIYIIVLVELFWTFANVAFAMQHASRTYGFFCAAGSLGSVAGNLSVGPLAGTLSTAGALWVILPMLACLAWGCRQLAQHVPIPSPSARTRASLRSGLQILRKSPYLWMLAALVALLQAIITLTDFRYCRAIEQAFSLEGDRTQALGNYGAIINAVSFAVQLLTGQILGSLGLARALMALPWLLGCSLAWALWRPCLSATALCQITGKSLDYSLFRAAKEILYIPLSYVEKTQGKALVDIFTYRIAKGGVSLLLLGLGASAHLDAILGAVSLGLCVLWLGCVVTILRRYRRFLATEEPQAS